MAFPALVFVLALLAGLDVAAVYLWIEKVSWAGMSPVSAALSIHGTVSVVAFAAFFLAAKRRQRPGGLSFGWLAAALCLLTPVLGCLATAWLAAGYSGGTEAEAQSNRFITGNPARSAAWAREKPVQIPVLRPLVNLSESGNPEVRRQAIPRLRQSRRRGAPILLDRMKMDADAQTQLLAQCALESRKEIEESELSGLRKRAKAGARAADHHQLCSRLLVRAGSGLLSGEESERRIREALQHGEAAGDREPDQPLLIFEKARCLLRLGRLEKFPEQYGKLCALPGTERLADWIDLEFLAARGAWRRVREAVRATAGKGGPAALPIRIRSFWLGNDPASST